MKKTIWIIGSLILAIVAGFIIGVYMYNIEENAEQIENNIEEEEASNSIGMNNVNKIQIETSASEEKISVNTKVIEEVYYKECDHLLKNTRMDIKSLVNMTREKLSKKYPDWEIKEFSKEKVILYTEEQNYCGEHFLLKDVDGLVTIYNMDNEDNIKERIEITEIETAYLPKTDKDKLKEGIKVYTQKNLNKLIEDFE